MTKGLDDARGSWMPNECALSILIATSLLLSVPARGSAHDLWLVPDEKNSPGKPAVLRASSGMEFPKSEHAPDPASFARRILILPDGSEGTLSAGGKDQDFGLLEFEPKVAGIYVAAVETKPKLITLAADAFNEYLVSDGLPHIYRLRAKEKTLDQPGRKQYRKSPKALIRVGQSGNGDPCRAVGLPLEIVPRHDPFVLKAGNTLKMRVLFHGQALADANLGRDVPGDGEPPSGTVRTDRNGEAYVPIAQTGLTTIRLTHMTRPKADSYEWESYWTTLTFRIPD